MTDEIAIEAKKEFIIDYMKEATPEEIKDIYQYIDDAKTVREG